MSGLFDAWIDVVCSDTSHEGKVAKVIRFTRWSEAPEGREGRPDRQWSRGTITMGRRSGQVNPMPKLGPRPYDDMLVGESLIVSGEDRSTLDPDPANSRIRRRRAMECSLCGLKVDARAETLYPILDKLADHGVSVIELSSLAAIVSRAS